MPYLQDLLVERKVPACAARVERAVEQRHFVLPMRRRAGRADVAAAGPKFGASRGVTSRKGTLATRPLGLAAPLEQRPATEHEGSTHENQCCQRDAIGSLRSDHLPLGGRSGSLGGARLLQAECFLAGFGDPGPLLLLVAEPLPGELHF